MSKIEIIMWCLSHALGRQPRMAEIRRAKKELQYIDPRSVNKVIKSAHLLYPYMTEQEIARFKRQICVCMLGAINYRIPLKVAKRGSRGYAICPRCGVTVERRYQAFCASCGQHLMW